MTWREPKPDPVIAGAFAMPCPDPSRAFRALPKTMRPRPGCADCGETPCGRHSYDVLKSAGVFSAERERGTWREVA